MIDAAQRVILNEVKNLAMCPDKVPARDPSAATLCQDDTNAVALVLLGNSILLPCIYMKKIGLSLVALLMLCGCTDNAIRDAVERQMTQFPQSTLQDLYKSFFQDRFGPGHLIADEAAALRYLQYELATMDSPVGPVLEPTGYRGEYTRVSLSVIKDSLVTVERFFDVFMRSALIADRVDVAEWQREWHEIEREIRACGLDTLPDYARDSHVIDSLLREGHYVMHHSEQYGKAYRPHYRIIRTELVGEIFDN